MHRSRISQVAFAAGWLAVSIRGQLSGWIENQQNATMCSWDKFRTTVINDTVYIDGGYLFWVAGLTDGSTSTPQPERNPPSIFYTLNFGTPFNTSTNFSEILTRNTISNNLAPNNYDGALLGNDHEFFAYGGVVRLDDSESPLTPNAVVEFVASIYGADKPGLRMGPHLDSITGNISRYITNGGAVSAPSENKAWYFGGYRSESWGPIYEASPDDNTTASNTSDYLITVDLATQQEETWKNETLGSTPSRADPSVVWVPVGEQGILVVLGGVTYPSYLNFNDKSTNEAQSKKDSPGFMRNIDIYDVASGKWYQQTAESSPPQLARGCAVVAPAQDYSSFNIYYYGGYDGLDDTADFNDNVWILSLPSFMWMQITPGNAEQHGQAGHSCVMPYPDQMIVIGGRRANKGSSLCLSGENPGILQAYNLTEGRWMDSYDPNSWNYYGVPEMISNMIGGNSSGGATVTMPSPSGWTDPELGKVFDTPYPTSKLVKDYPYSSVGAGNDTRGVSKGDNGGGGGTPSWVAPVLGVVLGLIFVTLVVVGIFLYRRRWVMRKNKNSNGSEPSTEENRIISWMRGTDGKAQTETPDNGTTQCEELESRSFTPAQSPPHREMTTINEMADTQLYAELGDTSPRAELDVPNIEKSPLASNPQTPHTPRPVFTPTSQAGLDLIHELPSPPPSYTAQRPDSPPLGNTDARFDSIANAITTDIPTNMTASADAPTGRKAVVSGLSSISDRDISHLRQISNTTTDSQVTATAPAPAPTSSENITGSPPEASPPVPVSPPSVAGVDGPHEAADYTSVPQPMGNLGANNTGSPSRRSVFRENEDDLDESEKK
ncbi:hypothetical protein F5Y11DRAFT_349897 [Daldinia sp. FL1419]|nr:hypothetical protein F5Y11DRAFT_349897 [Daldinia sp. FL1419]